VAYVFSPSAEGDRDAQKRIKDQRYDLPRAQKIDITIVGDMLLADFDSK
jgi:type I site-specific restriction-modification system R (restriction) subunit